jgi:hypothetical protein
MDADYAALRQEYENQHRALVEAQRAWIATGELRDKAEAEIGRLRTALDNLCRVVEAEGEHFADDEDECPICTALFAAHATLK